MLMLNFSPPTSLLRILIYLIQMTREIEVHEPLHSHNAGHVSEQYVGIRQKIVFSNKKKPVVNEKN